MRNKLRRSRTLPDKDTTGAAPVSGPRPGEWSARGGLSAEEQASRSGAAGAAHTAPALLRHSQRQRPCSAGLYPPVEPPQRPAAPHLLPPPLLSTPPPPTSSFSPPPPSLPPVSHLTEKERLVQPSRRRQLSPSSLHSCLEEIKASNPSFPARTVFDTLQRKAGEDLRDFGPTAEAPPQSDVKGKRTRGDESCQRASKRPKCGLSAEGAFGAGQGHLSTLGNHQGRVVLPVKERPRGSKLSRSHRLRQQRGSAMGPVNRCELDPERMNERKLACDIPTESSFEDVLWTDKYSPRHSSEVIGNSVSVSKLHSWLKKWKLRADCEERRKMEEGKDENNSNDSWDCGDFSGEALPEDDREVPLCNAMLLTGPPGVGKTASVYACAQELGFKVFEVNCSSQRSGRHVLSQLKEATQSHLVDTSGKDPLKPAYLCNYNTSSCTLKPEALPGKTVPPKNVIFTTKKRRARNFGRSNCKGKANPATVTLAAYFKMKAKADQIQFGGLLPSQKPDSEKLSSPSLGCGQTAPQSKMVATSLILFEEVDVIFSDDVGFLTAIRTFMTTTKRPVILTTNDPLFRERFSCSLEEVVFKTPSVVNVFSYLQLVCLVENAWLELDDISNLLRLSCGDIRRCLLQLQLWVHTGGGWASLSVGLPKGPACIQYSDDAQGGDNLDSSLSPDATDCTTSMQGLHPVTQNQLLNLLECHHRSATDTQKLLSLLAESWRSGVPLLYTNLELLLPFGNKQTSVHCRPTSVTNSKSVKKISRLSRRKHTATVFDTTSSSTLTPKPQRTSSPVKRGLSKLPSSSDKTEQRAKVATVCLDALSDFFDLMSYLDVTLPAEAQLVSGSRRPEDLVWMGAEVKDGFLDEMREEGGRNWSQEQLLDFQAAAEGFGFHRCWWQMSEAWTETQQCRREADDKKKERLVERLMFPTAHKRQSLRFRSQPLCPPSVSQRRSELSRAVRSSKSLSLLGNRRAVSVDYLPALRSICRFHRAQLQNEESIRCLNYLSSINLGLSKSTFRLLAEDFS